MRSAGKTPQTLKVLSRTESEKKSRNRGGKNTQLNMFPLCEHVRSLETDGLADVDHGTQGIPCKEQPWYSPSPTAMSNSSTISCSHAISHRPSTDDPKQTMSQKWFNHDPMMFAGNLTGWGLRIVVCVVGVGVPNSAFWHLWLADAYCVPWVQRPNCGNQTRA